MRRLRLLAAAALGGPLLAVMVARFASPLAVIEPPTHKHSQGAALAITGTWVCRDSRSFPVDWGWGGATTCTLSVQRLSAREKRDHQGNIRSPADPPEGVFYPEETEVDARLSLSDGKKRWTAPDSTPGWIGPDGCLRFGPVGSCLTFRPTMKTDGKLILKHPDTILIFERQQPVSPKPRARSIVPSRPAIGPR
jgi:hypothetical protein